MTKIGRKRTNESQLQPLAAQESGSVQSVYRALLILDVLAEHGGEASLTDIAGHAGLNVSTCHHLISTLANCGYVARTPGRRAYSLGSRILHLSNACLRQVNLPQLAERHLNAISAATGEAVQLAVLQGTDLIGIVRREARHALRVDVGLGGKVNAAHATASGKAILAWLPETELDRILTEKGMTAFTPKTITSREILIEELRKVRRSGLALDRQEFQPGVVCVAAAVRDHVGGVFGAISVSVPIVRGTIALVDLVRAEVSKAARELSIELGAPGSSPSDALVAPVAEPENVSKGESRAASRKCEDVA